MHYYKGGHNNYAVNPQDVNECEEGTDHCTQACFNTAGTFRCGCNPGYQLASDGQTCKGNYVHVCLCNVIPYNQKYWWELNLGVGP